MPDNNSSFNRIKVALDSVRMINILTTQENPSSGNLDPVNINEILNFNLKHLQLEKSKGGFNEEDDSIISNAIFVADDYIKKNPNGGGNSKSVVYFQDCKGGFYFALDFTPQEVGFNIGEIYNINAAGYLGCGQVIPKPTKTPPTYTKPAINSAHKDCAECTSKL